MSTLPELSPQESDGPTNPPAEPKSFHSLIMVWLVVVTIAGCCWLISSDQGGDGQEVHKAWRPGSVLRAITTVMALNFEYPTRRGSEVKWLVQGLGAAAALLVAVTAWYVRRRPREEEAADEAAPVEPGTAKPGALGLRNRPAWDLAALALMALTGWMLLSTLWSPWWQMSLGEGVRQAIFTVWAVALGRTLTGRGVRQVAVGLVAVLAVTAAIGVWYHFERYPTERLKFPIGNPIFLASCLLPGIAIIFGWALGALGGLRSRAGGESDIEGIAQSPTGFQPVAHECGDGYRSGRMWLSVLGAAAGLAALLWAMKLADSRGPQLGLAVGLVAGVCLWLRGRARRGALVAVALFVIAAILYVQLVGPPSFIERRLSTVTFRQYAWSYALRLFAEQPLLGHGQGSYVLLSQQYAVADAREEPQAFVSSLHGHAHNEYLEILADLGIVGFALIAAALAATLRCAVLAVRDARDSRERGVAVGLGSALIAMIVAEMTGVALRMPGFPVIFYAVIGLIWAQARALGAPVERKRRLNKAVCWMGLAAGLAGSWAVALAAEQDWKGALAERASVTAINNGQWDEALRQSVQAGSMRLAVEARLLSADDYNLAAYLAAVGRWSRMSEMLGRLDQTERIPANIVELAKEDAAVFTAYARACAGSGDQLLQWIPGYPAVAGRVGEILLLWQNVEIAEQRLGLRKEVHSFLEGAKHFTSMEFERDPSNSFIGVRLLQLSADGPVDLRIDILRRVFRGGPRPIQSDPPDGSLFGRELGLDLLGEFEPVTLALLQDSEFAEKLDELLNSARGATTQPASAWPDAYAPETLRLAALDRRLRRLFVDAVELADQAVLASEKIAARFPAAPARAMVDRTRCLLLAFPDDPEKAVVSCRQAIARWPVDVDRRTLLKLRRALAFYLLASGDEQEARRQIASLEPQLTPQQVDRIVGAGLGELCQTVGAAFPFEAQPKWFNERLERSIELVPDWSATRWLAASVAFSRKDSQAGIGQLEAMERALGGPDQMIGVLEAVQKRFPQDSALAGYVRARTATRPAADTGERTQPGPGTSGSGSFLPGSTSPESFRTPGHQGPTTQTGTPGRESPFLSPPQGQGAASPNVP